MDKERKKIVSIQQACQLSEVFKQGGKKVVLATGDYDIFHPGHLFFLEDATQYGDILIVGVASDRLIKHSKNKSRPVFNENDRLTIVSALEIVSYALIFSDIIELIEQVNPNILAISPTSNKKYNKEKLR